MLQQLAARIFLLDRAECRWRGEETLDLVLRDDAPECAGIGRADRLAFVEDRRAAGEQRAIDDVRMADDPAAVRRRPEHVAHAPALNRVHRLTHPHPTAA